MTVLDFFARQDRDTLACFKASGASGIARYLTDSPFDRRQISKAEVADAHAVGLGVHFAYEMNPTYPAYFTFPQGAEDCRQAQERLTELGAPDGTVVYFTVDTNVDPVLTVGYFNGIESAATPRITPGIYGYQRMCEYAHSQFPNLGKHLWQTYGTPTLTLDLWQHLQEDRCGVSVDVNDAVVDGWIGDDMTSDEVKAIIVDYLANTYGPALEAELVDRQGQAVADAVRAVGQKLTA